MRTLHVVSTALLTALFAAGISQAQDTMGRHDRKAESAQPVDDTWITTKVKAEMMAAKDVPARDISVETVNGVVSLRGAVQRQSEADKAIAVARQVKGVTRVDSSALKVVPATTTP